MPVSNQEIMQPLPQQTATVSPQQEYQAPGRALVGIVMGVLTYWLFSQSVMNAAPGIVKDLGTVVESVNMAISLAALVCGCVIVIAGGFADKFGRVKITRAGFVLSIISSMCLIFAQGITLFIIGRILQGLSAACIMAATLALIKTVYHGKNRQRALSYWSIGSWGGGGVSSFVGGAIATSLGWRWIFVFCLVCAVVGLFLIRGLPENSVEQKEKRGRFDFMGMVVFIAFIVLLNFCLTQGSHYGWSSPLMLGLCAVCLIIGFIFFGLERRAAGQAFIDFSLFKNLPYSGAVLSNFLINATAAGTLLVMNSYLQIGRGFSAFQSGMLSIGCLVSTLAMIPVGERMLQKTGAKQPMVMGAVTTCTGTLVMAATFLPDVLYIIVVIAGFVLYGLGLGLNATPSTDTAVATAPEERAGVAAGIYKMGSSLGAAMGIALTASIYTTLPTLGFSISAAAAAGLIVNVGCCLIALAAVVMLVPRRQLNA